jgi:Sulfotransferase family
MSDDVADPVFVLSAPRSYSSVVCAMLGQHPLLHGLPETHLFRDNTMEEWWARSSSVSFDLAHGLIRAVAEIVYGGQSEADVRRANGWIRRRTNATSGLLFEELSRRVYPCALVDKSPSMVYDIDSMRRAYRFFPDARFIHLVRHPRSYGQSVLKYLDLLARPEYQPRSRPSSSGEAPLWIRRLAAFAYSSELDPSYAMDRTDVDPQAGWYVLNRNIVEFLHDVPPEQSITVRGEEVLADPSTTLVDVLAWLGLKADGGELENILHPERSPYAHFGPPGARLGNDILFLEDPRLRPARREPESLDGHMPWASNGATFLPEVRELARQFGYN